MVSNPFGLTIYHQSDSEAINNQLISDMGMLGITWLRYLEPWSIIESPQGTYHWVTTDSIVSLCAAANIQLIFTIGYPPAWGLNSTPGSDGVYYPNATAMATFATALVTRYGNAFAAIEIGNEEWSTTDTTGSIMNAQYPAVAQAVYTALRSGGFTGKIGSAALISPYVGGGNHTQTATWINNFYTPTNIARLFDYFSFHFYNKAEDPSIDYSQQSIIHWIDNIQSVLATNGDPNKKLWLSEFGWNVRGGVDQVTESVRAQYYTTMYNAWFANRQQLEKIMFWTMDTFPPGSDDIKSITTGISPSEVYSTAFLYLQQFIAQSGDNGISSYVRRIFLDLPLRYYRLGENAGTIACDFGSQSQNGTYNGGITLNQTSLIVGDTGNTSVVLNGSSGYITLPTTGLPTGANSWSFECWWKVPASIPGSWQELFHFRHIWGSGGSGCACGI